MSKTAKKSMPSQKSVADEGERFCVVDRESRRRVYLGPGASKGSAEDLARMMARPAYAALVSEIDASGRHQVA